VSKELVNGVGNEEHVKRNEVGVLRSVSIHSNPKYHFAFNVVPHKVCMGMIQEFVFVQCG
jgi:hypothetical protein